VDLQRAADGVLIIAVATSVTGQGYGYVREPGAYSDDQIAGWRKITDAVPRMVPPFTPASTIPSRNKSYAYIEAGWYRSRVIKAGLHEGAGSQQ
jgi:NADH:flavin oxidoreductase / NADH oxidase family